MADFRYWAAVVVAFCTIHFTAASRLSLTATPTVITEGFTPYLTLMCALQPTETSRRAASNTSFDIQYVSSIIVSREDTSEIMAKIIMTQQAQVIANQHNLKATGSLSPGSQSNSQFLELVWAKPEQDQAIEYRCEINALDLDGHSITLTKNISVEYKFPTDREMLSHIVALEQLLSDLKSSVRLLGVQTSENGIVSFASNNCTGQIVSVDFTDVYDVLPVVNTDVIETSDVFTGNSGCNVSNGCQGRTGYLLQLTSVTNSGFQLKYTPFSTTGGIRVRWTSYPSQLLVVNEFKKH